MTRWLCAMAVGLALGCSNQLMSSWATFALLLVVSTGLGAWAAKARPSAPFWHGWTLTFFAVLISGTVAMVSLYSAPPMRQPAVLIPWPQFAMAMVFTAAAWGAVGGTVAWALAETLRS